VVKIRSNLGQIRKDWVKLGQNKDKLGQIRSDFRQNRSNWVKLCQNYVQIRSKFG
jgi:hypothetical protein